VEPLNNGFINITFIFVLDSIILSAVRVDIIIRFNGGVVSVNILIDNVTLKSHINVLSRF
jgi:hypothetical protein